MGFKHYKFQPNEYVLVMKNGKVIKQGVGLSFFCNTLSTGMSVVPTVSFDTFFAFDDVLTSDFQTFLTIYWKMRRIKRLLLM